MVCASIADFLPQVFSHGNVFYRALRPLFDLCTQKVAIGRILDVGVPADFDLGHWKLLFLQPVGHPALSLFTG